MPICPVCFYECGALHHTPNGVMCTRCRDRGEVSPCMDCDRLKCEYCPSIDLDAIRDGGKKPKVTP